MPYAWMLFVVTAAAIAFAMCSLAGCGSTREGATPDRAAAPAAPRAAGEPAVPRIRFEHVALNVPDPVAMADWYVKHLGMKILRMGPPPANARFVADPGCTMMLELYTNPPDQVPDYASMDPLVLHVAFVTDDVAGVRRALLAAGAAVASDIAVAASGDEILILRDPWGVAIQFIKRKEPMLEP
jgi:catechol 2,3-dioxygenase-like lactoylglutathione lyase family enzyme